MNFEKRIKRLQEKIKKENLDAYFFDHPLNIFYLTGIDLSTGKCLVTQEESFLFVDSRYFETCQESCPFPVILDEGDQFFSFLKTKSFSKIGFDAENISYKKAEKLKEKNLSFVGVDDFLLVIRAVKDEEEKKLLRNAADLGSLGFDYLLSLLKEGITEKELALALELFWKKQGADKLGFSPIIAFGKNSSKPHYRPGNISLKKGMPVLLDIGVNLCKYHSDMTRVVFFSSCDPEMEKIYGIVKEAQRKAVKACKPGVSTKEIDRLARNYIREQGYGDFFGHGLGHGIGLDIHELPVLTWKPQVKETILEEGMAITIEPGIYLPGKGGVRIEDSLLITKNGSEDLTKKPKELLIL